MFTYRNKKTGVEVVVPCEIAGDWVFVSETKTDKVQEEQPKKKTTPKKKSN